MTTGTTTRNDFNSERDILKANRQSVIVDQARVSTMASLA